MSDLYSTYFKDYVVLGAWTVVFIVGLPLWIPLAAIGYAADRTMDWMAQKAVEHEMEVEKA